GSGLLHVVDTLRHAGAQCAAHAGRERPAARRPAGRSPARRRTVAAHRPLARGPRRVAVRWPAAGVWRSAPSAGRAAGVGSRVARARAGCPSRGGARMADVERMYIDGERTLAEGGAAIDVVNPDDRTVVARVPNGA